MLKEIDVKEITVCELKDKTLFKGAFPEIVIPFKQVTCSMQSLLELITLQKININRLGIEPIYYDVVPFIRP